MGTVTILALAVALALDAFSVAVATSVSVGRLQKRQVFRFAFHFGLFQAGMPLLGFLSGRSMVSWVKAWDHWLAFALLAFVGGKAIWEGLRAETSGAPVEEARPRAEPADPTRGVSLVLLSVATSIDAFAVGLSFAMLDVSPWYPVIIIGLVTAALTVLGMVIGSRLGRRFGPRMGILGGLVLIAIGVKILVDHLG